VDIEGRKVLVLGGWGLVGSAVCRELLTRRPAEIQIHSLRQEEAEQAVAELAAEAARAGTRLAASGGDIFAHVGEASRRQRVLAQLKTLDDADLPSFLLYRLLAASQPEIVIDCVNTATGIAYRDLFRTSAKALAQLEGGEVTDEAVEDLLESLYVPRLIRHIQVLYRGMTDAGSRVYVKVGTSGTGGMGLNIPYTHSEERPSRVLLSKSALAGAHSMLLFLMARTPGAPITKEVKPAAAIAWKRIAHGPIVRRGRPIHLVEALPRPLGPTFSTCDPAAARECDEVLTTVYIDTGENGIFSLEEFSALTTAEQMEFVTPEEIAQALIFEIEGGNTGHDVINALDNAVLGPSYRAGLLRHWALEEMNALERLHGGSRSVAFEMLGPPRITKLLFEAHLLREAFGTMNAVRGAAPAAVAARLDALVRRQPALANEIAAVGIPLLLASGEILRGPHVIVPGDAEGVEVTPERLEAWVHDGWVDLREANCGKWIERFAAIHEETESIPEEETSSRHLRTRSFWAEGRQIQPGKVVGWILSVEEHGTRFK
jgi:NAD(P)-dependent dehydrogenase (short-subunit alcohol dehydrogenase family)